jgi:glutathione S-transferase
MIVYGASMSPFVRKVLAFGAEKGIELENKPLAFGADDPEFRAASPFGKIPALRDSDYGLADSTAIIFYLDALRPEPNLIPQEPKARGRCLWWDEFADTMLMDCGRKMFFNRVVAPMFLKREGDLNAADKAEREQLPPMLDYLEGQVPDAGGFLLEDRVTLADLAVASPFVNLRHHLKIDMARWPRTVAYVEAIHERPSLKRWIDKEVRFFEKVRAAA